MYDPDEPKFSSSVILFFFLREMAGDAEGRGENPKKAPPVAQSQSRGSIP